MSLPHKDFIEFAELCKKYRITGYLSHNADTPLYEILLKLEHKETLAKADIDWLEQKNLNMFLGDYFQWMYKRLGNLDDTKRAGYYYELVSGKSEIQNELFAASVEITAEIHNLYEKLNIPPKATHFHSPKLLEILKVLDANQLLSKEDETWLEEHEFENVLGRYYSNRYLATNDPWMAIKSGKFWRKAKNPQLALDVTKNISSSEDKVKAAIFTNQGGAYRDLGKPKEAKHQAEEAIKLQPNSYHAYNLLGAIYYQDGFPETGDSHFNKAVELGSSGNIQENMIKTAYYDAGNEEREAIARYLLNKDAKTYSWVKSFIDSK